MKKVNRHFAILISCLIALFFILNSTPVLAASADVEAFVTRFYQQCLARDPDQAGLNDWVNSLIAGSNTGANVGYGFVFSTEFINLNKTDEEFLDVLYRAFFNRDPDSGGLAGWLNVLSGAPTGDNGTRATVLDGFLYSTEFANLCNNYGITAVPSDSGVTFSTDTTANKNLLTSFTGSNSVTVSGTWTNEYYGSTGDVSVNISFNPSTNVVTIIWDIDGNVYGGADPDPETFTIDMTDLINNGTATLTATSTTYGDISMRMRYNTDGTGAFAGSVVNEPTQAVTNASFSGTFVLSGGTVTFTVADSSFVYYGIPITCSNTVSARLN